MSAQLSRMFKAYDVRGLAPGELDAEVAYAVGAGFADVVVVPEARPGDRPRAVLGADMRPSGGPLADAFAAGLTARGADVVRLGLTSTDEMYYAAGSLDVPGVMVTASHNPAPYNGFKLCRAGARPVARGSGLDAVRDAAELHLRGTASPHPAAPGRTDHQDVLGGYAAFLRSLVDLSDVRPLTVVVDAGNGMAGLTTPAVLGEAAGLPGLPVTVIPLHFTLDGTFPNHEANPTRPENLEDLRRAVLEHGADVGLAFDGDADRCCVVDETGTPVSPSALTVLVGLREIERERAAGREPTIVHNLISSRAVPELLGAAGARLVRTRVGHADVKAAMARHGAVFGGEHSAHYYFRDFYCVDSGMLAALHLLATVGAQDRPLSALVRDLDPYSASGEIDHVVPDVAGARARILEAYVRRVDAPPVEVDELDGLTVSSWAPGSGWWFNVRASNTEPLVRLNVEATSDDVMQDVRETVLRLLAVG
ncbi:Phosphomannomutase [Cellulomonas flavigena DSM 20109]|uniref:Phosphomannomutase n=1 Tax=Cellulomonas flavigena (strain ATCC 482 / DSM 20109 / BCRC 11376 / JCM 18109 / NBRC 3775 / NCIMB 8073 / NRS 134) TaxID=446466 RepID=D5UDK0_CELFN|nr:phosphomannomutase/phosphoglucomutase [Cellulomonas flavigena]ADG76456.1 Phosphomannomutase [Cellulomonas flavigena DSM 20109]